MSGEVGNHRYRSHFIHHPQTKLREENWEKSPLFVRCTGLRQRAEPMNLVAVLCKTRMSVQRCPAKRRRFGTQANEQWGPATALESGTGS